MININLYIYTVNRVGKIGYKHGWGDMPFFKLNHHIVLHIIQRIVENNLNIYRKFYTFRMYTINCIAIDCCLPHVIYL